MSLSLRKKISLTVCGARRWAKSLPKKVLPYTDDLLFGAGGMVAVITTYQWSPIAGGYALAAFFVGAGVVIARQPSVRR